jgi:hypothetical protein
MHVVASVEQGKPSIVSERDNGVRQRTPIKTQRQGRMVWCGVRALCGSAEPSPNAQQSQAQTPSRAKPKRPAEPSPNGQQSQRPEPAPRASAQSQRPEPAPKPGAQSRAKPRMQSSDQPGAQSRASSGPRSKAFPWQCTASSHHSLEALTQAEPVRGNLCKGSLWFLSDEARPNMSWGVHVLTRATTGNIHSGHYVCSPCVHTFTHWVRCVVGGRSGCACSLLVSTRR